MTARTGVVKNCGIGGVAACIIPCNLSSSFGFLDHSCVSSFFIHIHIQHSFIHGFDPLLVCTILVKTSECCFNSSHIHCSITRQRPVRTENRQNTCTTRGSEILGVDQARVKLELLILLSSVSHSPSAHPKASVVFPDYTHDSREACLDGLLCPNSSHAPRSASIPRTPTRFHESISQPSCAARTRAQRRHPGTSSSSGPQSASSSLTS